MAAGAARERESNLEAWLLYPELAESDTSPCGWHMEPIVVTPQDGWEHRIRPRVAGSDSLYTGKDRLMEPRVIQMSISGQNSHLSQRAGQATPARSHVGSRGRVMIKGTNVQKEKLYSQYNLKETPYDKTC